MTTPRDDKSADICKIFGPVVWFHGRFRCRRANCLASVVMLLSSSLTSRTFITFLSLLRRIIFGIFRLVVPFPCEDLGQSILKDVGIVVNQTFLLPSFRILDQGCKAQIPESNISKAQLLLMGTGLTCSSPLDRSSIDLAVLSLTIQLPISVHPATLRVSCPTCSGQ